MSENPTPIETSEESESELKDQLDQLATEVGSKNAQPGSGEKSTEDELADQIDADLAGQIQSLLEDSSKTAEATAPVEESVLSNTAEPVANSTDVDPEPLTPKADGNELKLGQLDQAIAQKADTAVAGDFESVEDLLNEQELAEVGFTSSSDGQSYPPTLDSNDALKSGELHPDEAFESVDQRLDRSEDAQDVGAISTTIVEGTKAEPEPTIASQATPARQRRYLNTAIQWLRIAMRHPVTLERSIHHVCTLINRPLERFSPETRAMVGYVGVLTLFNATVLLVFMLAVNYFGSN